MYQLTYDELTKILDSCIEKIKESGEQYDEVIAVVRGGLTAAHYIAKELRLPVGVYFPGQGPLSLVINKPQSTNLLFVEDLVAQGRTYSEIKENMKRPMWSDTRWDFLPVLVDGSYPEDFPLQGLKSSEWVVFPYEKMEKMKEGDRGLFREGTDVYAK